MAIKRDEPIKAPDLIPYAKTLILHFRDSIVPDKQVDPHFTELFPFTDEEVQLQVDVLLDYLILELDESDCEYWYEEDCREFIADLENSLFSRIILWLALQELERNGR